MCCSMASSNRGASSSRNWSEYQLSQASGISRSTISSWYSKHQTPSVPSLEKICVGLGITLSQFFAEGTGPVSLTAEQQEPLDSWSRLPAEKQKLVRELSQNFERRWGGFADPGH